MFDDSDDALFNSAICCGKAPLSLLASGF